jgi:hypothetical protein
MGMDHRWGLRESIDREVVIDCDAEAPRCGRSRDMSLSGLFVSIAKPGLEPNVPVELVVTRRNGGATSMHRLGAVVARLCESGVALMFTRADAREIRRFRAAFRVGGSVLTLRRLDPRRLLARRSAPDDTITSIVTAPGIETDAVAIKTS